LARNLAAGRQETAVRSGTFAPFLEEAQTVKRRAPLTAQDLAGTGLGLKLQALLAQRKGRWFAMMPLRDVSDVKALEAGLSKHDRSHVVLLDMKRELDALYHGYRLRALGFAVLGVLAIAVLLMAMLRSVRRCADVLVPLAAAVLVTTVILLATGTRLNIFHLVALLLVVGVGSNYTLFFERGGPGGRRSSAHRHLGAVLQPCHRRRLWRIRIRQHTGAERHRDHGGHRRRAEHGLRRHPDYWHRHGVFSQQRKLQDAGKV
jgi:predicted exporter